MIMELSPKYKVSKQAVFKNSAKCLAQRWG